MVKVAWCMVHPVHKLLTFICGMVCTIHRHNIHYVSIYVTYKLIQMRTFMQVMRIISISRSCYM